MLGRGAAWVWRPALGLLVSRQRARRVLAQLEAAAELRSRAQPQVRQEQQAVTALVDRRPELPRAPRARRVDRFGVVLSASRSSPVSAAPA